MENEYDKSEYVSEHYNASKLYMKRSVFGTPKEYVFENTNILGVEKGEEYLTIEYGRWQDIPPVEKRAQHNFHYLNLELPYKEYIRLLESGEKES
jgi:lipopolysaccharide cholinephosphotransferase